MPFGQRSLADGSQHDFDAFYNLILRPLAQQAGFEVKRVDEIVEVGTVTDQAFRLLYSADVVVADVSAPNSNVYYELGVRQAISSGPTILIAVDNTALPFDISSQRVLFYSRSFHEDASFKERYIQALSAPMDSSRNPVQAVFRDLGLAPDPQVDQATLERELSLKIGRAQRDDQLLAVWHWVKQLPNLPTSGLLLLADRLAKVEDYSNAAAVLAAAYPAAEDDYEVHRQRGFYLRKHGQFEAGLKELQRALDLNPNDPQALGMIAGTLKRQGHYPQALEYYERALQIAPKSLYLRVATAGMIVLSDIGRLNEAEQFYRTLRDDIAESEYLIGDYWADLVAAESNFVLNDMEKAYQCGENAVRDGAPPADAQSTAEQIRMLGDLGVNREFADDFASWLVKAARRGGRGIAQQPAKSSRGHIIFHISDLHFAVPSLDGTWPGSTHRFVDDENSRRLSLELKDEFNRALTEARASTEDATLVVSGDITSTATSEEFRLAKDFLTELCNEIGLPRNHVVMVPGNHDVDWSAAAINNSMRFDNYLEFARNFFGDRDFYKLFPRINWDFHIGSDRPRANDIIYVRKQGPITFVGINSCVFEDNQHHYGFVGMRQLRNIVSIIQDDKRNGILVAVMHHHLHPYPEPLEQSKSGADVVPDLSTIRDAGLVEQRLERLGFSLVLHGHKHKPQLRETSVYIDQETSPDASRPLIVCGCGSTGVGEHELEHNQSNHYAVINFLRNSRETGGNFVRIEWRELALQAGAEWRTSGRWVMKG